MKKNILIPVGDTMEVQNVNMTEEEIAEPVETMPTQEDIINALLGVEDDE